MIDFEDKAGELYSRALRVKGAVEQITQRKVEVDKRVSADKRFVELQPNVVEFLDKLQQRAHQRSVGAYERMLTAIVDDVLAEQGKRVAFDLKISRGLPSLFVSIDNDGNSEDIVDGQGGSVANVVSAGLRYIALSRLSEHRKFVLLDEPDCWLSPDKIPAFFNVLNKLSKEIGIQSVVISHHDASSFGDADIVMVTIDEDDVVEATNTTVPQWKEGQSGIRKVRLFNYMSHEYTEFDLSPGVTVICGDNNIGKSAIVSALRAVAYNEGREHMIKHGEEECCVEIFIENDVIVRWSFKRKGKDKTKYELLTTDGNLLHEENNGKTVPDWISKALKIDKVNGIDVHISHQKTPMFMLNETPAKRAEILSMGKESQYLQKMISLHKDDVRVSKQSIKNGEQEITSIDYILGITNDIDDILNKLKEHTKTARELSVFNDESIKFEKLISDMDSCKLVIDKVSEFVDKINIPAIPVIHEDCMILEGVIENASYVSKVASMSLEVEIPVVPEIYDCVGLIEYGVKLSNAEKLIKTIEESGADKVSVPDIPDIDNEESKAIEKFISDFELLVKNGTELAKELKDIEVDIDLVNKEISKEVERLGGECPLCGNELNGSELIKCSH